MTTKELTELYESCVGKAVDISTAQGNIKGIWKTICVGISDSLIIVNIENNDWKIPASAILSISISNVQ